MIAYNELCFCDINKWTSGNTEAGQLDHLSSGPLLYLSLDKNKTTDSYSLIQ